MEEYNAYDDGDDRVIETPFGKARLSLAEPPEVGESDVPVTGAQWRDMTLREQWDFVVSATREALRHDERGEL